MRILQSIPKRDRGADVDFQEPVSGQQSEPERKAIDQENLGLAVRILRIIPRRDREVLTRFYLNKESVEDICRSMDLSKTQFRFITSRARGLFSSLTAKRRGSEFVEMSHVGAGDEMPRSAKQQASLNPELLAHAVETFGSAATARVWLSSECGALNNRTPLEAIQSDGDEAEAERVLDCIDYGMLA